jgi:hypothetical protein
VRGADQPVAQPKVASGSGATTLAGLDGVVEAAELAVGLRRSRVPHLKRLRAGLPEGVPLLNLPMLFIRTHGTRATHAIAGLLEDELV